MYKILSITTFLLLQLNAQNINFTNHNWQGSGGWTANRENNTTILNLVKPSGDSFNLYFNKNINISNATLSVDFKANSGKIDQGGGIMWNIKDEDNYLVARFNPLEDNFRFYTVTNGLRVERASANIKLDSGWHTMSLDINKSTCQLSLDNKKLLNCKPFNKSENIKGVGLWSKADALTSFKNFNFSVNKK